MVIRLKALLHRRSTPSLNLLLAPYSPPAVHSLPMRLAPHPVRAQLVRAEALPGAVGNRS